jgi:hypothetical protein
MKKLLHFKKNPRSFFIAVILLFFTISTYSHVTRIRVKQNQDGTLTWRVETYHSRGQCGVANSGIRINGVSYPLQFEGSMYESDRYTLPNDGFSLFANASASAPYGYQRVLRSYGQVTTPYIAGTLNVQPYSTNACWAFSVGGNGSFNPPPPPVCTSFPLTSASTTVTSTNNNGTPCNLNDDTAQLNVFAKHLACGNITGDKKFKAYLDSNGNSTYLGEYNYNSGITTPIGSITVNAGQSYNVRLVDNDFPGAVYNHTVSSFSGVPESTPPTITLNGPSSETVAINWVFNDLGATAFDNCGSATVNTSGVVNTSVVGTYTLTYTAIDPSGNVSNPLNRTVNVIPILAKTKDITVSLDANGSATIQPSDVDNGSILGGGSLSLDNSIFDCSNIGNNQVTLTVTSGGSSVSEVANVTIQDTTKPEVKTNDIIVNLDANGSSSITTDMINNGSADACGIASMVLDNTSFTCENIGVNQVELTVTDNNGNVASSMANVTVNDATLPTVITQDISIDLDENGAASITADMIDNGSFDNCAIQSIALDNTSFSCNNVGYNQVTLTVTDSSGNTSSATANVTVKDVTAPNAITQNIVLDLDVNGSATITADMIDNGSSDACGIESLALNVTSFSCEKVGANQVILTVTDTNGNSSTANATVTINDVTAPAVTTQDISIDLDETGNASITTDMIDNGSADACGIASIVLDNTSFTCENVGVNQVELTVTDNNGNVASSMANVTVNDATLPTVITQDISVNLDATGNVSITPEMINNASFDNCGIKSIALNITEFSCSNVGNNSVTLTVTDNNDNVATATANVSVNDVTAPTVITQSATVTLANGTASISTFDVDGGTFDNCSFSLTLDNDTFSCDDIGENTVTLTATDASGNTSSQQAIVNVVGDIPTVSINDFNAVQTQKKNTIFLGFGPSSMNLNTVVSGGSGFTYDWSASTGESVANVANPSVSPMVSTTYNVIVTNSNGCTASTSIYVCVIDARAFDKKGRYKGKVTVCHHTSGKKGTKHVLINISKNAVMTHLTKHGRGTDHADSLGACNATCVDSTSSKSTGDNNNSFTTSIKDNLNVYPNPSKGMFDVRLTGVGLETAIILFDINGKLIERKVISAENSEQNIITIGNYNLSSGIYLLKITNQNESISKKIIVTKD